jgi:hypothetical protein
VKKYYKRKNKERRKERKNAKNQVVVLGYKRDKEIRVFLIRKYYSSNGVISKLY